MTKAVLHITAHMGGGVGRVVSGVSRHSLKGKDGFSHRLILLEEPEKRSFVESAVREGVNVRVCSDYEEIGAAMEGADIVQLEWWHHPLMARFLRYFPQVPVRLAVWCHTSGSYYPWLPFAFVKVPHEFVFTSRFSAENPFWSAEERAYAKTNCTVVNSSGGFDGIPLAEKEPSGSFTIGYSGTLSYAKLHPQFPDMCAKLDIPSLKIVLVGDIENREMLESQFRSHNVRAELAFRGYVDDIGGELSRFDVFAYPLNPRHYGTTENALLEAMAAGLPVVALNQCAERYLVKHMKTGLLADDTEMFVRHLQYLYENPGERKRLGGNARAWVRRELSLGSTVERLNACYGRVLTRPKRKFSFVEVFGENPHDWVSTCLGSYASYFVGGGKGEAARMDADVRRSLLARSKSSLRHFAQFFPEDPILKEWKSTATGKEWRD